MCVRLRLRGRTRAYMRARNYAHTRAHTHALAHAREDTNGYHCCRDVVGGVFLLFEKMLLYLR